MAGRTQAEAVQNYLDPLQKALSCFTHEVVDVKGGYYAAPEPHALTLSNHPAKIGRDRRFAIKVVQHYRVVEWEGARGPWKVTTVAYLYTLEEADGPELLGFHFHPRGRSPITYPHLRVHPGTGIHQHGLDRTHIPTGRVALESVLRFAVTELNVMPLRDDWEEILDASQAAFEAWRTWV